MENSQETLLRKLSGSNHVADSFNNFHFHIHLGVDELRSLDSLSLVSRTVGKMHTTADRHFAPLCVILNELVNNALDHGILRLDSSIKQGVNGFEDYLHLRQNALHTLTAGWVDIEIESTMIEGSCGVRIVVADSGNGFDYSALQNISLDTSELGQHGRGLALVRSMAHKLVYSAKGNEVTAYYVCN